jgi:hypothetical protein
MNGFNKILTRHSFIFLSLILVGIFVFSNNTPVAGASTNQFAGKIIQTKTPPITCTSQYGLMVVQPKGGAKTPGPFIIQSTTKNVNTGGQILGKYDTVMDLKTCYIQAGSYRVPVPVYKIKSNTFNTSRR